MTTEPGRPTLEDVRARAAAGGHDLSHIEDDELLRRLVAMPEEAAADFHLACRWLVYAYVPDTAYRR